LFFSPTVTRGKESLGYKILKEYKKKQIILNLFHYHHAKKRWRGNLNKTLCILNLRNTCRSVLIFKVMQVLRGKWRPMHTAYGGVDQRRINTVAKSNIMATPGIEEPPFIDTQSLQRLNHLGSSYEVIYIAMINVKFHNFICFVVTAIMGSEQNSQSIRPCSTDI
jgi:hypothetical protein